MQDVLISTEHLLMILTATIIGTLARIVTIKEDFRVVTLRLFKH